MNKDSVEIDPVQMLNDLEENQDSGESISSPKETSDAQPIAQDSHGGLVLPTQIDHDLKEKLLSLSEDEIGDGFDRLLMIQLLRNSFKLMRVVTSMESMIGRLSSLEFMKPTPPTPLSPPTAEISQDEQPPTPKRANSIRFK